jgi:hypothetical protein
MNHHVRLPDLGVHLARDAFLQRICFGGRLGVIVLSAGHSGQP